MKSGTVLFAVTAILITALALPVQMAAQQVRYKLVDMGTLGGPASYLTNPGNGLALLVLNEAGVLVGRSDTATFDPILGDFRAHAFRWGNGVLSDLGTPAGAVFSQASGVNDRGWIAIDYSADEIDPLTGGPIFRGSLWKDGEFIDLGVLGDGLETDALYVNNAGQVVGFGSISTDPDPFSFLGGPIHPFIWQDGVIHDLGTLGGPDALPNENCNNQRTNFVTGFSFADSTPNPDTGIPTMHPVLWQDGKIIDLGSLGGTLLGDLQCANSAGQVAGAMTLPGNSVLHAFFWEHGIMKDLGTLGGDNSSAYWINERGDVIGKADLPDGTTHAVLWRHGITTDLGTLGSYSYAHGMNSKGQVVGKSILGDFSTRHAFLWEKGGPMVDLNTLIPPNSPLELGDAENINDRGEIAGRGTPPGCDDLDTCGHAFLLIPCGDSGNCENRVEVPTAAIQIPAYSLNRRLTLPDRALRTPMQLRSTWHAWLAQWYPSLAHKDW